jgi:hypothetical protein
VPRRLLPVVAGLALSACAMAPAALRPISAQLTPEVLVVRMSDGRLCRGARPAEGGWRGPLNGCPDGWRYAVDLDERTNIARALVEAVLTALTLEGALSPLAEVTVTGPDGRTTAFVSPPAG